MQLQRILIDQLDKKIGQEVKISGFVQTIRDQGSIKFLIIRDISGTVQVVVDKSNIFSCSRIAYTCG
jgi:aspartyl/asparaginyl-tRNA synthetase